ncbi:MAG: hypothetical protein N2689_15435 [Verrucomicrobiae bacterium]|nr:hypothetical protein [Verrucomicrobiae bacterium]
MPGKFMMGSEKGKSDELPVHEDVAVKPFYISFYEVPQEQPATCFLSAGVAGPTVPLSLRVMARVAEWHTQRT